MGERLRRLNCGCSRNGARHMARRSGKNLRTLSVHKANMATFGKAFFAAAQAPGGFPHTGHLMTLSC
jgi:hypothetical protein